MIEIIENFISTKFQDEIEEYVYSESIPYRLHKIHNFGSEIKSPLQLTHHLYMHEEGASPHFPIIKNIYGSLLKKFGEVTLFRAKINITTPHPPYDRFQTQEPHVDLQYDNGASVEHLVCLYYINDSDGPTVFFNESGEQHIQPKKGTAVIFDGSIVHAGSNPLNHPFRAIVNIDFRQGLNQIPWYNKQEWHRKILSNSNEYQWTPMRTYGVAIGGGSRWWLSVDTIRLTLIDIDWYWPDRIATIAKVVQEVVQEVVQVAKEEGHC